jgi:hypothetical protein
MNGNGDGPQTLYFSQESIHEKEIRFVDILS